MSCYIVIPIEQEVEGVPTEGYDPFYFPPEGGTLVFRFTNASFTRVLSALRNGAAMTYDDQAFQVVWDFLVNVEYPVSVCDLVAECFATDEAFRESVIAALMADPAFVSGIGGIVDQKTIPTSYPPGVPNPFPNENLAGASNPGCDPDILWAQALAIAVNTNASITDVLEKVEVSSNVVELIDALSEFPLVGWAKDALGGSITVSLIQYYQEAVAEEYAGQYTTTPGGVQDEIACAIFCACQDDCEITVAKMFEVFKTRLEVYITVPALTTMGDLIDFAAGISQDNTMVVDLAFFVAWGSAALGSFFFGEIFDTSFQLIMDLSVNDANDDWILLCEDCATPPPPDPNCVDFTESEGGWVANSGLAQYYPTEGWGTYLTIGNEYLWIRRPTNPAGKSYVKLKVKANQAISSLDIGLPAGTLTLTTGGPEWEISSLTHPTYFPIIENVHGITLAPTGLIASSNTVKFIEVCLYEDL